MRTAAPLIRRDRSEESPNGLQGTRRPSLACFAIHTATLIAAGAIVFDEATAELIRVPDDYSTVAAALDAAVSGDSVLVGPGDYFEELLTIGSGVTLLGDGDREDIWIEVFEGITLEAGPDPVRLEGLSLRCDSQTRPDVIWAENAQCEVIGNLIIDEYFHGDLGATFVGTGGGLMANNWIESGRRVGVRLDPGGQWLLTGNTLAPTCELGVNGSPGFQLISSLGIDSLVVRQNTIRGGADIYATALEVANNIFYASSFFTCPDGQSVAVHHNLFEFTSPHCAEMFEGEGNLVEVDPEFCDIDACDYRVSPTSPAVAAGENGETLGAWPVGCAVTGVSELGGDGNRRLSEPYPNPSTGAVHIDVDADAESIAIFDVSGRQIAEVLVNANDDAVWDRSDATGSRVAPGVYFLKVMIDDGTSVARRVVLR